MDGSTGEWKKYAETTYAWTEEGSSITFEQKDSGPLRSYVLGLYGNGEYNRFAKGSE